MTTWTARPVDEARLLNPAFIAVLLGAAGGEYEGKAGAPMPWTLSFLIAPLVLAARSRDALPTNTRAHFPNWVQQHPEVRLGFPERAQSVVPLVRDAIRVGARSGALELEGGGLRALVTPRARHERSDEVRECLRSARFVGRWFAAGPDVSTRFALLGVRP